MAWFIEGDIVLDNRGQRFLILAVGEQAYFVRAMDRKRSEPEPREFCQFFKSFQDSSVNHVRREAPRARNRGRSRSWLPVLRDRGLQVAC